jgi:outer membrane receptor for ferrienterochelin and colicin
MGVLFVLAAAAAANAQSESGKATLEGTVLDPSGKTVHDASIAVSNRQTGLRRTASTNETGKFRLPALPVGDYEIEATATGFGASHAAGIQLTVGSTSSVTLTLAIATVTTQVNVEATTSLVSQVDTSNSVNLGLREIEDLPIRGRNFTEFVQLSPGVMQEQNRYGIVYNGQRSINANVSLDGVDFSDPLQGGQRGGGANESAFFFPQLAVREFQIVRDGASAEVGRTNSGYLNVVTKSGTNEYHGAAYYANRNGAMTSPDAFGNDLSTNAQNQFGGAVGGPIRSDKLFFFGAVEKNMVTIPYTVKFDTPSGGVPIPSEIAARQGTVDQINNPLVAFGRLDYQATPRHSLNVQYTYAAQYGLNFGGVTGGTTNAAATNNTLLDRASQGVKAGLTSVISPTLLNEVRGQYAYDNRVQKPNSPMAQVDILDMGTIYGSKNGTYIYNATRYQILDTATWTRGRHSLRFGIDLNFSPQEQQRETNYGGLYTFNTLADYNAAVAGNNSRITRYQQTVAASGHQGMYTETQRDFAAFITDTFRLNRDLTLTAGLRWDGQVNPQPPPNPAHPINGQIPNDLHMWQPRLGIAWNIGGKGRTVLRASGGLFIARTPGYLMQRVFTDDGVSTLVVDSNVDKNVLNYLKIPEPFATVPPSIKPAAVGAIFAFDPAFQNPRSGQAAIALEQQIDRNTKITVGFTRNSTWSLQRRIDTNLFAPIVQSDGNPAYPAYDSANKLVYPTGFNPVTYAPIFIDSVTGKSFSAKVARPDPSVGQINVNTSVGHSSYNGLQVSLQQRMARRFTYTLNYTYAHSRDDDSNERDFNRQTALNTFNLTSDAAVSKNDIRHSGNLNALYDIGRGFTISTLLFARTGMPVKPVTGIDLQNDGNTTNDRPFLNGFVMGRNSLRQPGFFDWDIRLVKSFRFGERARLDFSIEGFNVTRSSNKRFNGDGETSSFGTAQATVNPKTGYYYSGNSAGIPTVATGTDFFGGARQAQLGVRFFF